MAGRILATCYRPGRNVPPSKVRTDHDRYASTIAILEA